MDDSSALRLNVDRQLACRLCFRHNALLNISSKLLAMLLTRVFCWLYHVCHCSMPNYAISCMPTLLRSSFIRGECSKPPYINDKCGTESFVNILHEVSRYFRPIRFNLSEILQHFSRFLQKL